ncbi:MAG: class I SAM-dependent methyltransferase [Brevibacillus sp.]|nr:class I SAM-dependent methyltransferase [Brevibacillus sp.]
MADAWFEKSFREDYLLVYRHRDEASADREIANLLDHLPVRKTGRVLDLCCGSGRHSRALARRGYEVVGVDLSPVLLEIAREQNTYDNLVFHQYDMREIPFVSEFDIVVNLFTSFGYFATDEENARVVHNMARALKPGGEVVIDYLNPAYIEAHLIPESERETNGLLIRERRWIESGFVKKEITIVDAEQPNPRQYLEQVRLYHSDEMEQMLRAAGFGGIKLFGDYEYNAYDRETSPRMIFYAVRE